MSLQGNLREFSANDILQLLGTQKKTGCLILEGNGTHTNIYVHDGRLVATREPGMAKDDPLLRFLYRAPAARRSHAGHGVGGRDVRLRSQSPLAQSPARAAQRRSRADRSGPAD